MVDKFSYEKILYFKCKNCGQKISLYDLKLKLWNDVDKISEFVDDSFHTFYEVSTPSSELYYGDFTGGAASQTIDFKLSDSICGCDEDHNIRLYVSFIADTPDLRKGKSTTYVEEILEFIPLTSDTLDFTSDFLILKGKNILKIIHYLFERWIALGYQVEIFCPYITIKTCWEPLLKIVSNINSEFHEVAPISIFTRNLQDFRKRTLEQQILFWINKENLRTHCFQVDYEFDEAPPCYEDPYYNCIHNFGTFITSNIYTTNLDFHGKYYLGVSKDNNCEIVNTSFNLVPTELDQFETFKLLNIKNFNINNIRPELNWTKFQLDETVLRKTPVHGFIRKNRIKRYIKSKNSIISDDIFNNNKLNSIIQEMLDYAIERAKSNKRKTVKFYDI